MNANPNRPHPLRRRAVAGAVVTAVAGTAVALGAAADVVEGWVAVAGLWIAAGAAAGVFIGAEGEVTPVEDPAVEDPATGRLVPLVPLEPGSPRR